MMRQLADRDLIQIAVIKRSTLPLTSVAPA